MAMQIRLGMTAAHLEAERKRSASRDAIVTPDIARNIGAVSGTSVGGRKRPRTHQKFSPCLITYADGSQKVIAKQTRTTNGRRTTTTTHYDIPHRTTAADLPAIFCD